MKPKTFIFLLTTLLCVITGSFLVSIIVGLNEKYPAPPREIHGMGEQMVLPENDGISFKVIEADFLSREETDKKFSEATRESNMKFKDYATVILTVELENGTDSNWSWQRLRESMLSVGKTYSNGLDLISTSELGGENLSPVKANSTKTVELVYSIKSVSFTPATWEKIASQEYYFVYSLHPVINEIKLLLS